MKITTNQKGTSIIEITLIIVVIGLIATVGWLVYERRSNASKTLDAVQTAQSESMSSSQQELADNSKVTIKNETDSWVELSSSKGAFKIKIPDGWTVDNLTTTDEVTIKNPENLVYSQGKLAVINPKAPTESYAMTPAYFGVSVQDTACNVDYQDNVSKVEFSLNNGIKGTKYTGEVDDKLDGTGINVYQCYCFQKANKYYTVTYRWLKSTTDNSAIVEKSVRTLTF